MPDFDPSSVPMGVDGEVGGTPASTIRAARKIERRGRPLPQPVQGVGDAWILIAFIVALGLIFVVAAWATGRFRCPGYEKVTARG
jgi:ABC-type amino acid transport system permease subunit